MRILRNAGGGGLGLRLRLPSLLLGFLATSFQIFLLREFAVHFYGNELTFGFVLGAWLLWGGIGSLAGPRLRLRPDDLPRFYTATILLFFLALVVLRFSHRLLGRLPGELTGLVPAMLFALGLAFFVSFPLGVAFVLNASLLRGDAPRVYLYESLGAAAAGLTVHFLLIPYFSNWQGAAIVSTAAGLAVFAAFRTTGRRLLAAVTAAAAALLAAADLPALRAAWKPYDLVTAEDSPYGKLQILKTGDQFSMYDNGLRVFSYPDTEAAEEAVHFALLQRPGPKDILLIGGGVSGGCAECLKYPDVKLDYVEIDPAVIRLAERYLPAEATAALRDPRVRVINADGRAFVERAGGAYDAVILSLPEPATAQINRFYTREFFARVAERLKPDGVLSFVVPSAENYISRDLQRFLETIVTTLSGVFPEVAAAPGGNNVFLASRGPLSLDPGALAASLERLGVRTRFVSPEMLPARLDPRRTDYLAAKIHAGPGLVNRDLVPVSYYFHSILWAAQFKGVESAVLRLFARIPPFWILDAPLLLAAAGLALAAWKKRRSPGRFLVPIALAGFSSILVEMAVLVAFQAFYGYVYGKISLLLSAFMAGLAAGSWTGLRRKRVRASDLAVAQAGFAALLFLGLSMIEKRGPEALPFLLLFAVGGLAGFLFVAANRLYQEENPHPGMGYGVDLLGSFVGVITASAFVIPLLGIPRLLSRLAVLSLLGLLYLVPTAFPGHSRTGAAPSA